MRLTYRIRPRRLVIPLVFIALVLSLLSLISDYIVEVILGEQNQSILAKSLDLFSVNLEDSIPTWYSVLLLFSAAVSLLWISLEKYRKREAYILHWFGLAGLFLYLSMDEGAAIHEIFAIPLQEAFDTSGFFYFGWQIVAIPLVILFGLIYFKFLHHLPAKTRKLFLMAAILYAGGALIVEGISANQWFVNDGISMTYLAIATLEELCEMLGVTLFLYALLDYIVEMDYAITFSAKDVLDANEVKAGVPKIQPQSGFAKISPTFLIIVFLLVTNVAALAWIVGQRPQENRQLDVPFYHTIVSELHENETIIIDLPGVFGADNLPARQMAASLLEGHEEVVVVALPASKRSIIFAGDSSGLNRERLTDLLHADGQIEFIIFETETVAIFTADL